MGTFTPGTTGSTTREGCLGENATETVAWPFGLVSAKLQTGWLPFGAAIVIRIRDPAR